ncbi:retrotransposon nucleocapsid protein [Gigaspora margarita]|uniref:Retrotransposon nucleocapsid protein n=1 Tax=Gigaspora margarita TaxID=4874 RepID=A0A8H4B374_GIGMA|nr:retrotransposon nucleocapsid protein [Gigaspora margarita]
MNNSYCHSHKKTPYELVYGDKPKANCTLVEELFSRNIRDEEEIPDTIDIQSVNCTEIDDLENTMEMQDYQENLNDDQENNENIQLVDTTNTVNTGYQIL